MKRFFAGMAAALLAAISLFPIQAEALSAEKAILMDAQTGRVLYERKAHERSLIASTTKIMTALIVCEQCNVLDRVRIPKEAVGVEGSSMYLTEGEVLTIQDLLYGLMLQSGNDAAVALAIYCGGSSEGFAELMNDKARKLGMLDSHFVNPNGLDAPGHYSTAYDMAILSVNAMRNPIFAKTVSTKSVRIGDRYLQNHNKLLWQLDFVDGIKTGYTRAAGRILVSSAVENGRRLVAVTINAPDDWCDHKVLLSQGFSNFCELIIASKGDCLGTVAVEGGDDLVVELISAVNYSYPVADGEEIEIIIPEPKFVYAPVVEGQNAGVAFVCINGDPVDKIALVYGQTVEIKKREERSFWSKLLGG